MHIFLPPLHSKQMLVAMNPARFRVVCCGRHFGKTRLAVLLALAAAIEGKEVMWVAPSFDKALIGWRLFEHLAKGLGNGLVEMRRGERRVIVPGTGGWVGVYSASSEGGLRGEKISLLIVDEAAHIRDMRDLWEVELRPALTASQGRAVFISTPLGFNYFYELFIKGERGEPGWASFRFSSYENPFIDRKEIDEARRQVPDLVFRQEYLAEFVQLEGALFRREYFKMIDKEPELIAVARFWDLAASAKTMAHYSVGVKAGMDKAGNFYILDCVRGRWEWPELIRIIGSTALADGERVGQYVEAAGVQRGLVDLLRAEPMLAGVAFRGIEPKGDKIERANPWLARAEQGKVFLLRGSWVNSWLDEVCAFPAGEYDDQVDATSGAFVAITRRLAWPGIVV